MAFRITSFNRYVCPPECKVTGSFTVSGALAANLNLAATSAGFLHIDGLTSPEKIIDRNDSIDLPGAGGMCYFPGHIFLYPQRASSSSELNLIREPRALRPIWVPSRLIVNREI